MSQEDKINAVYEMTMEMRGDLKAFKVQQENHENQIKDNVLKTELNKVAIDGIIADRNRVIGIAWVVTALGGVTGIIAIVVTVLKHI